MILIVMGDLEGFRISMEELTADAVEMAKELQLDVEPEDVTELLQFHDKTFMQEHRRQFLEMETTPGEDAVEIVKVTTKDLECYTNLIDKVASSLQGIDSDFEGSYTAGKML